MTSGERADRGEQSLTKRSGTLTVLVVGLVVLCVGYFIGDSRGASATADVPVALTTPSPTAAASTARPTTTTVAITPVPRTVSSALISNRSASSASAVPTVTMTAPHGAHSPNLFTAGLKACANLHVGYDWFPAGMVVHWRVNQTGTGTLASGAFTTLGGGRKYHFFTTPLGVTLKPDSGSSHTHVRFFWNVGTTTFVHAVTRDPGC